MISAFRQREFFPLRVDSEIIWEQLEHNLKKATANCSDATNSSTAGNISDLPYFMDEILDYGLLLDLILVNWPQSAKLLTNYKVGRKLLRRYAADAFHVLVVAYETIISKRENFFYEELKNIWNRRADIFFDGTNFLERYIDHRYGKDHSVLYAQGDTKKFIN